MFWGWYDPNVRTYKVKCICNWVKGHEIWNILIKGPHVPRVRIGIYRFQYTHYWNMNIEIYYLVMWLYQGYSKEVILLFIQNKNGFRIKLGNNQQMYDSKKRMTKTIYFFYMEGPRSSQMWPTLHKDNTLMLKCNVNAKISSSIC